MILHTIYEVDRFNISTNNTLGNRRLSNVKVDSGLSPACGQGAQPVLIDGNTRLPICRHFWLLPIMFIQ